MKKLLLLLTILVFILGACSNSQTGNKKSVDLTEMSSTMQFGQINNMLNEPDNYLGQKIKFKGILSTVFNSITNRTYYICYIMDELSCCSCGLEFRLKGDAKVPDNYKDGSTVCVEGIFNKYYEGSELYYELKDATIIE